jgi:Pyrimidine operon attenuation protein/uracil phosphoribosyltransferase
MSTVESSGKSLLDADALSRTCRGSRTRSSRRTPTSVRSRSSASRPAASHLAQRLARLIEERAGEAPELGAVDITFYRDDVRVRGGEAPLHAQPLVRRRSSTSRSRDAPCPRRRRPLHGRTIRAAIEALFDYGRPARVQLAVSSTAATASSDPPGLHRQEPADRPLERIQVQLVEVDEVDQILLVPNPEEGSQ